ncbi:homoserine O-acetyltransferase [Rhodanobacter thiooxydans]|uniref:Serine O-succinyltransferase n=1 Tax=Rhodanobacter thiooxydans TaxID=416169 RepID=A0A154QKS4_9GAMM|nr:homoserine O-acetyltransferase [Rhodanobacter thiooxydans]KZC24823.1 homoserine O-acetyltransferase [Rhodanobacter thiooxydans]MCW0202548.1 homoserine O-acetyltransferase [Rhodanobacter thiooxydans]
MGDARRYFPLPSPFAMKRGGALHGAHVAYETWGTLNAARDNAVLVLTGLSPSAHMTSSEEDPSPGWWQGMAGPGKAIDTTRWFVICVNSLGSDKGSTCPASIDPATGEPYQLSFPELALEDVANAAHGVADSLGITQLACLIGCSMGGMSALAYMLLHPGSARAHISVDTAPQAQPFAIAIRSLQREAIRLDPQFNDGNYDIHAEEGGRYPDLGMSIARKLGVITYRSAMEWNGRFARIRLDPEQREDEPFGREFQVESYLEGHARRFVRHFDPNSYLYLSRASDWFDIAEYGHGSVLEGLKRICVEQAMVIGVSTDILFPLQQQEQIVEGLEAAGAKVEFVALDSPQGHDAFLVDIDNYSRAIGGFLNRLTTH